MIFFLLSSFELMSSLSEGFLSQKRTVLSLSAGRKAFACHTATFGSDISCPSIIQIFPFWVFSRDLIVSDRWSVFRDASLPGLHWKCVIWTSLCSSLNSAAAIFALMVTFSELDAFQLIRSFLLGKHFFTWSPLFTVSHHYSTFR